MMHKYFIYLTNWIKQEVEKTQAKGVVIGISGGIDSALVATIAKKSFPNNSIGVIMPIGIMGQDQIDAENLSSHIKIKTIKINLTNSYDSVKNSFNFTNKLAIANIKPRLRMTMLYAIAQEHNYLVLGTDNAAEWLLGYFTKYGDGGVDLLPIIHLTKGEVGEMVKMLELPSELLKKSPSAGLWDGQTDEEELGFKYTEVDKFLKGKKIDDRISQKIIHQRNITEHKRVPLPRPLSPKKYSKND